MRRLAWLGLTIGLTAACGTASEAPSAPSAKAPSREAGAPREAVTLSRPTQSLGYQVALTFDPAVPPMGELFAVDAVVTDKDGLPLEGATVELDARMPHHNHGMMTDPVDLPGACDDAGACTHPEGRYRTEGFKFHMPGAWTITVDVTGPRGHDSTSFVYEMR